MKEEESSGMTAILNIFSGRPDPIWTLTVNEVEAIKTKLKGLDSTKETKAPALGYRGFTIINTSGCKGTRLIPDFPALLRVHRGVLTIWAEEGLVHKKDSNKIEKMLLDRVKELSMEQKLGLEKILP